MKLIKYIVIPVILILSLIACKKNTTEPKSQVIPLDGRGGGVIAYCYQPISGSNTKKEIFAINADGTGTKRLIDATIQLNHHDWSPDGEKLACVGYLGTNNSTWSIHVFNADGTNFTRLTTASNVFDSEPAWSPDGSQIAFTRIYPNQNFKNELWAMDADGSNQYFLGVEGFGAKWSPDGHKFIYTNVGDWGPAGLKGSDIFTCDIDGTDIQQITNTSGDEWYPIWSPDGNFIAFGYSSDGSYENNELYIMNSDITGRLQLTNNNVYDGYPRFSPGVSLISFTRDLSNQQWEIFKMNIDGSNVRRVTNSPSGITAINAVWKPVN